MWVAVPLSSRSTTRWIHEKLPGALAAYA